MKIGYTDFHRQTQTFTDEYMHVNILPKKKKRKQEEEEEEESSKQTNKQTKK